MGELNTDVYSNRIFFFPFPSGLDVMESSIESTFSFLPF